MLGEQPFLVVCHVRLLCQVIKILLLVEVFEDADHRVDVGDLELMDELHDVHCGGMRSPAEVTSLGIRTDGHEIEPLCNDGDGDWSVWNRRHTWKSPLVSIVVPHATEAVIRVIRQVLAVTTLNNASSEPQRLQCFIVLPERSSTQAKLVMMFRFCCNPWVRFGH